MQGPKKCRKKAGNRRPDTPARIPTYKKQIACIGQGSRTEIAAACEAIRQGARMEDVAAQHSETYVKYHRGLVQLHAILQPKKCFKSLVLWLCGEAGSGKSRCARQVARGAQDNGWTYYSKAGSTKWFDGYSGNECMIWDELTDEFPFTLLLQILDCYELQVKTKGGNVNFNLKLIIITTNYDPTETFKNITDKHLTALHRRINHCLEFTAPIYQDILVKQSLFCFLVLLVSSFSRQSILEEE